MNDTTWEETMDAQVRTEVLEAARQGIVPYVLIKDVASRIGRPAPDLLDDLSCFVAVEYAAGRMDFDWRTP